MITEYFKSFFAHHTSAYVLIERSELKILDFNDEAAKLLGITSDFRDNNSLLSLKYFDQCTTQELSSYKNQSISGELRNITLSHANAQKSEYNFLFSAVESDADKLLVLIEKRVMTEGGLEHLSNKDESFRSIIDQLPNAIVIHDFGEILYANPYFSRVLGISEDEIIGRKFSDLVHSSYKPLIEGRIALLKEGIIPEIEHVKFEVDGKLIAFSIQSVLDEFRGTKKIVVILSNLEMQQNLAKESIRANLAVEANIHLEKEILHHKKTQERLIKAEELTRSMISSSIDMIISSDQNDQITHISPSACFIFGYKEEEIISSSPKVLYSEESEYHRVRAKILRDGFFIGEVKNRRNDGEIFTSYLSASPIRNEDGEVLGFMGVSRDITELKKAENELIESERRYRELFETLTDAIIVVNERNEITQMNEAAASLFEVSYKDNKKHNLYDFIVGDSAIYAKQKSEELVKEGVIKGLLLEIITGKGNRKMVELSSKAFFEDGVFKGSRDILRDITSKLEADALLLEQTSKLESIFENSSNVMICTLSKSFDVTSFNSKYSKVMHDHFGHELNLVDNFSDLILPRLSEQNQKEFRTSYAKAVAGVSQHLEYPVTNKNGETIWFETYVSPILIDGQDEFDLVCLSLDITDKKKTEYEILMSLQEKEVLLKEVHHRVKNNLQVISSILNLQSSYVKDENTLNILRESQNRIKSMSFIHESLYRTENFSSVNFSQYIENLSRNLVQSYIIEHGNISLNLSLGDHSLNLDQAIPCGLIINELVSNAIKYAFPSGRQGEIIIDLQVREGKMFFDVCDNGVGLPQNFDIEETDTLGLQLVTTLISQLDGDIEVINSEGTKYLFNFTMLE